MNRPSHFPAHVRSLPRLAFCRLALVAALCLTSAPVHAQPGGDDNAALQYWQAISLFAESMQDTLDSWDTVPLEGDALAMASDDNPRLELLHAGAAKDRCYWAFNYDKGPELLLPHLAEARNLARTAWLRARHRFEHGRPQDAVDDVMATFELARDVGVDPILVAVMVRYGIEDAATQFLAQQLPKLSPAELDRLARRVEKLPAGDVLKQVWATETRYMVDWFEARLKRVAEDGKGDWSERVLAMPIFGENERTKLKAAGVPPLEKMLAQLEEIRAFYRELETLTDLPQEKQADRLAEFRKRVAPDNALFQILAPNVEHAFGVRRRDRARRAMLLAAIAVQREGPERLKDKAFADPFGGGPFEHRKTAGGFELQSMLTHGGKPVVLEVGDAKGK